MIGSSQNSTEKNIRENAVEHMKKKPRLSAFDRPSNNRSLVDNLKPDLHDKLLRHPVT